MNNTKIMKSSFLLLSNMIDITGVTQFWLIKQVSFLLGTKLFPYPATPVPTTSLSTPHRPLALARLIISQVQAPEISRREDHLRGRNAVRVERIPRMRNEYII